jgi:hypothetical protein
VSDLVPVSDAYAHRAGRVSQQQTAPAVLPQFAALWHPRASAGHQDQGRRPRRQGKKPALSPRLSATTLRLFAVLKQL